VKTRAALIASTLALAALGAGSAGGAVRDCPSSNPPNELALSAGSGQTARLGQPFQNAFQVALANTNGCAVTGSLAGVTVEFDAPDSAASGVFASSGSRVAFADTNAQGVAAAPTFTANDTVGAYRIVARSSFGSVAFSLFNTATGLPAAISVVAGSAQSAIVDSPYANALQVRVADANGGPVQGVTVSFGVVPGSTGAGASFAGAASAVTDSNGLATAPSLRANGTPGSFIVTASTDGVSAPATYFLDNHALATTLTAASAAKPAAIVETRFRQQLQARVLDASGAPVEGTRVSFSVVASDRGAAASFSSGGTQATALTGPDGVATAPTLVAGKTAGTFTVSATATGSAASAAFTLVNLPARPSGVTVGAASGESTVVASRFPVSLAVTVSDANGNVVPGAVVVFAAPAHGPSGRFTHGRRRVSVSTDTKGIAIAPAFAANASVGGYAVAVTVTGTSVRAAFALVNRSR
jgi:protocatechuate 3,4-dioxygenase beta subunit